MKDQQKQLRAKLRWGIVGIFALLLLSISYVVPQYTNPAIAAVNKVTGIGIPEIQKDFKLGLDLQGGAHLIYRANVTGIPLVDRAAAVEGVRDAIERRVNGAGIGEANIQTSRVGEDYRLNVELPGIEDVNEAITMIGETPILEFREPNDEPARELTEEEREQLIAQNIDAKNRADESLAALQSGTSFEDAVKEFSSDELTKNNDGRIGFLPKGIEEFSALYDWAASANEGDVSDTVIESDVSFHVLKRGAEQDGEEQVEASHILVCYLGAQGCHTDLSKEAAQAEAQRLFEEANASNFAALAEEFSTDLSNSADGGALGSFPRGVMIPAFEEAVFSANVGEIIGPVETAFGYHVIYKTGEEQSKEYELFHIAQPKLLKEDIVPPTSDWKLTELSGKQLERAEVVTDYNTGALQISLQFDSEGAQLFEDITRRNIGSQVAIFLDGQPISIPTVNQAIAGGQAVITGSFTLTEAKLLAQRLNTGALPVPIDLISQQAVGASLGAESLNKSLTAGMIAIVVVMIFMVLYYRLPGILSVISLSLYIALTLALFKFIGVTLTLAGIAGLVLSIGMAVDANVLIFERLKEELRDGKSLKVAIEEGFLRAWTSIRDGNVSTLITCGLLIWFGSSFVQGFALTLAIGILVSMFSAITVSRALLRFIAPWFPRYANKLFLGAKKGSDK